MNGLRKPRQVRWPESRDTLRKALLRAGRLMPHEVDERMAPLLVSHKALREGVATLQQWAGVASAVAVGLAIEKQGVVRGKREDLRLADFALRDIKQRSLARGAWKPSMLSFEELDDIKEAVEYHRFQLQQLSAQEYHQAVCKVVGQVTSSGGTVQDLQSHMEAA